MPQVADAPEKLDPAIAELVDRGGKLAKIVAAGEKAKVELDAIKAKLREHADGKDAEFAGEEYVANVEQKDDAVCRVVPESKLKRVIKLAGDRVYELFSLHPSKGAEKSFELNAYKLLTRTRAVQLLEELTVEATAWVRFS